MALTSAVPGVCMVSLKHFQEYIHLSIIANNHFNSSINNLVDDHYAGAHWLATSAIYTFYASTSLNRTFTSHQTTILLKNSNWPNRKRFVFFHILCALLNRFYVQAPVFRSASVEVQYVILNSPNISDSFKFI